MELLKRFDDQKIYGKPDRSAPVRIAAEQPGGGFRRLVLHRHALTVPLKRVWMFQVMSRHGSYAVIGKELRFVEHSTQEFLHSASSQQRKEPSLALTRLTPTRYQGGEIGPIRQIPFQPLAELREFLQKTGLQCLHGE